MKKKLENLLLNVETFIEDSKKGLPEEVFYFISKLTPLVNVDLLIKNEEGETLLTWRHDKFYGPAWHIPGGIIRFREKFETRIQKVAMSELGADIIHEEHPMAMRQLFAKGRDIRGHFISHLFLCKLKSLPTKNQFLEGEPEAGQWSWHKEAPQNMLTNQAPFIRYINETKPL